MRVRPGSRSRSGGSISPVRRRYIAEARIALDAARKGETVVLLGREIARASGGGALTEFDIETRTSIIQVDIGTYRAKEKKLDARHDIQLTKTIQEARREVKASNGKIKRKIVVHLVNPASDVSQDLIDNVQNRGRPRPGTPEQIDIEVRLGPR